MSLSEIAPRFIQQSEPGLHKRWFSDEELDLTVWQEEDSGRVSHFQLVFRGRDLVEWATMGGLRVGRIQGSVEDQPGCAARTYLLSSTVDPALVHAVREEFAVDSGLVVHNVREFVLSILDGDDARSAGIPFELPNARAPAPPPPPESRALSVAWQTPGGILRDLAGLAAEGFELMAMGRRFCLLQRLPGAGSLELLYQARSKLLRSPDQIVELLTQSGREGLGLAGVCGSHLYLKRTQFRPGPEFRMEFIGLRTGTGVRRLVERLGPEGWGLSGLGFCFAYFERASGCVRAWEHKAVRCRQFDPAALERESAESWRPCALGAGQLFFRRPV